MEADFQREYRIGPAELWAMSARRFGVLLSGLSPEALFLRAFERTPRRVTDPAEIARLTGMPAT
ncbi:hypothetical protein [Kitasatospora sp. NPDC056181]|uniref:hypothetical protein n=1 Tax=Kitasatospora sp. NPDC056181 TaxID=3345737 RepID=UPI0035D8C9F1